MKTNYEYLQELCGLPADFNAFSPQNDPQNKRVRYLMRALDELQVGYQADAFAASKRKAGTASTAQYVNIMACIPARSSAVLAVSDYANANDNTASCANLLELAGRLQADPLPDRNVYLIWTDAEEICSFHRSGAWRLAQHLRAGALGHVAFCLNLELTAHGSAIYTDEHLPSVAAAAGIPITVCATPFNDTTVLRYWGIPSCAVVGTLQPRELSAMVNKTASCPTWRRCHRATDQFVHANKQDMAHFVNTLYRIVRFSVLSDRSLADTTVPEVRGRLGSHT
jgi:hypothetical protein